MTPSNLVRPFRLIRWFAAISAVVIGITATVLTLVLSSFMTDELFKREAQLSSDFIEKIVFGDGARDYLRDPDNAEAGRIFNSKLSELTRLQEVFYANVYTKDFKVLWSTNKESIGQRFTDNHELEDALKGETIVEWGRLTPSERSKAEHKGLSDSASFFVEVYIPIKDEDSGQVLAAVELYKAPVALTLSVNEVRLRVAVMAAASGLALYLSLFWLIRRADATMTQQQQRLRDVETQALIGEMSASVAHNIRNPLSSIRSSAELNLISSDPMVAESAQDIIREVDRISVRVTDMLRVSRQGAPTIHALDLPALLKDCVSEHGESFRRRGQSLSLNECPSIATVVSDESLLMQVMHRVLSNASEAMPNQRACVVSLTERAQRWIVSVRDQGHGIDNDTMQQLFRPFFTTKPQGLGLGLAMSRRIIESMGGELALHSTPGLGTTVSITLPKG